MSKLPRGRKFEPGQFEAETPRLHGHILNYFENDPEYTRNELARLLIVTPDRLATRYYGETHVPRTVRVNRHLHSLALPGS